ncbi:MAG: SDR family oxidoreductase [Burkholderiaceae bacterium]|nr:SDR family oxidoreductase [Burkholderiaceae bacterium]
MTDRSKVIIVTGGASGIGLAYVEHLARAGHRIAIADINGSEEAARRIRADGLQVLGLQVDVSSEAQVKAMVDATVSEFGQLDALVNNAALFANITLKPFEQIPHEEWTRIMSVNATGPFLCSKAAVPAMRKQGAGRIVNIASVTAIKGAVNMLAYVASKGAVIAMTRGLARELGADNITVNALTPGLTLSDGVLKNDLHTQWGPAARVTSRSIQRDQLPGDLLGALSFLISDNSSFMTGQTVVVDGGGVFV